MSATHVALLRGINVGGKNILPMKELSRIFVEAGCSNVQTYIQSGNVVFSAPARLVARLPKLIEAQIAKLFSLRVPIVLRSAAQLGEVANNNPYLAAGAPEEMLHVVFLADMPSREAVAGLDSERSPGDSFVVRGQELYLKLPNGAGKSKLTNAYFDSRLKTVSTGRNWRTVLKLLEMSTS
jgi:uncharacterized protein (DUF1697 family)